jgi:hypothetical protein
MDHWFDQIWKKGYLYTIVTNLQHFSMFFWPHFHLSHLGYSIGQSVRRSYTSILTSTRHSTILPFLTMYGKIVMVIYFSDLLNLALLALGLHFHYAFCVCLFLLLLYLWKWSALEQWTRFEVTHLSIKPFFFLVGGWLMFGNTAYTVQKIFVFYNYLCFSQSL